MLHDALRVPPIFELPQFGMGPTGTYTHVNRKPVVKRMHARPQPTIGHAFGALAPLNAATEVCYCQKCKGAPKTHG